MMSHRRVHHELKAYVFIVFERRIKVLFAMLGGCVFFKNTIGIPMATNFALLCADVFL